MTPPLLLDVFAPPVTYGATAGIYTAAPLPTRLPTLAEVRERRRSRQVCVCTDGTCRRCFLDDDRAFELSQDV